MSLVLVISVVTVQSGTRNQPTKKKSLYALLVVKQGVFLDYECYFFTFQT